MQAELRQIEGARVFLGCVVGGRGSFELVATIERSGASVVDTLEEGADVLVVDATTPRGVRRDAARAGALEIDAPTLFAWLREREMVLPRDHETPSPRDALVGELRGASGERPYARAWPRVVALLDLCEDGSARELARYASGALEGWVLDGRVRAWAHETALYHPMGTRCLGGEWRVGATRWTRRALEGEGDGRILCARALSLQSLDVTGDGMRRLMAERELAAQLTVLDMGHDARVEDDAWRVLARADALSSLHTLYLFPDSPACGAALARKTSMPSLRRLHLRSSIFNRDTNRLTCMRSLFESEWLGGIETLEASTQRGAVWTKGVSTLLFLRRYSEQMSSLTHLVCSDTPRAKELEAEYVDRLQRVTLRFESPRTTRRVLGLFAARAPTSLTTLDVSQHFEAPGAFTRDAWAEALVRAKGSLDELAKGSLRRVLVGAHAPRAVYDALGPLAVSSGRDPVAQ